jgi:PAS domain S-box-containing protein
MFPPAPSSESLLGHDDSGNTELRASEERFRKAFDQAAIGMAMTRTDGSWMAVNPALGDLLGYEREMLLDRRFLTLAHPDDRDADAVHFRDILASDAERFQIERRFLHRDGHFVWVALTVAVIRDVQGKALYTLAQMQDITERTRIETLLRESEERYRTLVEFSPDGILVFTGDVCRYANPALTTMLGYSSPAELIGMPVLAHVHPSSQPQARERIQALVTGDLPELSEFRLLARDGAGVDVETMGVMTTFEGAPAIQLVLRDTTERKRAEREVRERETLLRGAFDDAPIGMALTALDGRWVRVNQALCDILGYSEPELLATSFQAITHRDDLALTLELYKQLLSGARSRYQYEKRYVHRLGHSVWVSVTVALLRDENGQPHHQLAQIQDVTERKQAEERQSRQTETLQAIFDHIPAMVAMISAAGKLVFTNGEWVRVTGWTLEETRELDVFAELYPDEKEQRRARDFITDATGAPADFRLRTRDGRSIDTTWVCIALSDGSTVGFGQDMTEHHHLENQLRQAQKLEAVGRLAGGVAHDFNNLLTVIQSNVSFLLQDIDRVDPRRKDVLQIRDASTRAAELTHQLLAYSRQQLLKPRVVDVDRKVENVEAMLRRVIGEDIVIETHRGPTVWPVLADAGQLEQVLMNLAVNARDAMPSGGILHLRTGAVEVDSDFVRSHPGLVPGAYTSIVVEDTGTGIAPDIIGRVFEPFYTTKAPGKGTGLGLSTVYGIVKQSGGHVYVESVLGEGSRFTVLLPRHIEGTGTAPGAAPSTSPRGTERILVAEDEKPVRAAVRRMLERQGYKVLEAANGAEALGIIDSSRERIDLVLTDVVMPDVGGRLLAECIEGHARAPRLVYMSGYTDDHILRDGLAQPGTAFLQKPFTPEALARVVRDELDRPASSAA